MSKWYAATGLNGGAPEALEMVPNPGDYTDLVTGDNCFVLQAGLYTRIYQYDEALADAEDFFGTIIIPDGNVSGTGAWKEKRTTGLMTFWAGTVANHIDAVITEAGGVVSLDFECTGSIPGIGIWSDDLNEIPIQSVTLSHGSDSAPTANYLYILSGDRETIVTGSEWPATEHVKISYCLVPSAAHVAADGAYILQNWNDGNETNGMGHLSSIGENIRLTQNGAHWNSGVAGNGATDNYITIDTGTTPDSAYFLSTAGVCFQMHRHIVPAKNSTTVDDIHVVNNYGAGNAYTAINDIRDIEVDAVNGSLTNKYYNIVFWMVANKSGEYAPIMMNMPTGSYNGLSNAINDVDGYDVYDIPREFKEDSATGFLVCRITFRQTASAITVHNTTDLRGRTPGTASGTALTGGTEFADNQFKLYNIADITRIVDFDLVNITTGNTRTVEIGDYDGIIPGGTVAGATDLYYADVKAFETMSSGIAVIDTLADDPQLTFKDNAGATEGYMRFYSDGYFEIINKGSECYALGTPNGSLALYYDGVKTFATTGGGIGVYDDDGTDPYITMFTDVGAVVGQIYVEGGENIVLKPLSGDYGIRILNNGATNLYHAGVKTVETVSEGLRIDDADNRQFDLFYSATSVILKNYNISGGMEMQATNSADAVKHLFEASPDGAFKLYHAGVNTVQTTATGLDTLFANEWTKAQNFNKVVLGDQATISWDPSLAQVAQVVITANRTMGAPISHNSGGVYILEILQDGTGGHTISWHSDYKWEGGIAPTLASGASEKTYVTFISNASSLHGTPTWTE